VKAIYDGCQALKNFPHLGRPGRMSGRRELIFALISPSIKSVEISRIYHGAQDRS
jgi:plasmid stabilization system protein ParE